jgi:hypothetical protein
MREILLNWKRMVAAAGILVLLATAGCSSLKDNSNRSIQELANHMITQVGGTVDGKVFPVPVKASDGISIRVEGRDVFFYVYNPKLKKQKHKLDQIRESKKLYINGIAFQAVVNGCFVMIEHETNIKKKELLDAFEKF